MSVEDRLRECFVPGHIQGWIYYVADAAYAAGLALIGASRYTVPRPLPQEHAHFLFRHAHF